MIAAVRKHKAVNVCTFTAVNFHSHRDMIVPSSRFKSYVACLDWRAQRVRYRSVAILICIKLLEIKKKVVKVIATDRAKTSMDHRIRPVVK